VDLGHPNPGATRHQILSSRGFSWGKYSLKFERPKAPVFGHRRRSAWPRGIGIDSKKSWAPPGTFMGVRPHPDPDEGS
jgi:hypothetical protein